MVSQRTGVAMNKEEYVPTTIPTNIANINPLKLVNNDVIYSNKMYCNKHLNI